VVKKKREEKAGIKSKRKSLYICASRLVFIKLAPKQF
jgi:hypothetical protein